MYRMIAKRLNFSKSWISSSQKRQISSKYDVNQKTEIERKFNVEEIKIKVPFGHVAGKWWGSKDIQPIITMHGWQDNAGTFDRLIPLLPENISFLCLDLPGHGLSSRLPHGMAYHAIDNLYNLSLICNELKLDKVTIMGHSLGSILSFLFASVFADRVNMVIGIDALKPMMYSPEKAPKMLETRVKDFMRADFRNQGGNEPPAYTIEEMEKIWVTGTRGSVTYEVAHHLLKRNIKESVKFPGKFYFSRDSRMKYSYGTNFPREVNIELAKRLHMPYLFIKALKSPYYEDKKYFNEIVEIMKQNPKFELEFIDATHHLHLTEPEKIAPIISDFLNKYWTEIPFSK